MSYEKKLEDMGYVIEPMELDTGKFVMAVKTGNLIFVGGQVPVWGDKTIKGKVDQDISLEEAYEAAKICALNNLRAVKTVSGSLDNIVQIVKILGMVNVSPGFNNTTGVIHGCSDLLRDVFGPAGYHARSAVGVTIPFNYAVEIEMIVEVAKV
jgi:enamine deaminase RidA (YjgF/YER057c/UK114 family)